MNTTHALGWQRDLPDQRDYKFKPTLTSNNLPVSVDLRSQLTPVYDQGQLGSCTANAVAAHIDFDRTKQGEQPITPSRLFIYYNERVDMHTVKSDSGASIRESIKAVVKKGAVPESEWPYVISKFTKKPLKALYTEAVKNEGLTYLNLNQTAVDLKTCLASGLPFIIGFTVYDSFESQQVANDGIVPMPAQTESVLGGHAVLVVGYTTLNGSPYFICRNSWGAGWGDKGYFYMPEAYLLDTNLSSDFWTLQTVK